MIGKRTAIPIAVVLAAIFFRSLKRYSPIVEINLGKLQGIKSVSRDGREFLEFLGIPYANPPVGNLRFEPPEELTGKWDGVRDASSYGPVCIQANLLLGIVEGEEDCLHLNVHTPQINPEGSVGKLMPVIVFFHGGIFAVGSGNLYGPKYFMDEDVVLVTVNSRLGSFGFLNTGDGVIRGNMGLKDQTMALQWIQKNIQAFGGNPTKVTLMGQSAGGASAQFHMMSPMSKGLFHKVIAQSGSALNPWVVFDQPRKQALRFAGMANCTLMSTKLDQSIDVNCLKKLSASDIVNIHKEYFDPLHETISLFTPTVEKDIQDGKTFLSQHPKQVLKSGDYYKVPMITGMTSDEGTFWTAVIFRNETAIKLLTSNIPKYIPRALYLPDDTDPTTVNKIIDFYSTSKTIPEEITFKDLQGMSNVCGDRIFNMGILEGTELLVNSSTKSSPVFLYYYSYKSQYSGIDIVLSIEGKIDARLEVFFSMIKNWIERTVLGRPRPNYGVAHGDEVTMQMPLTIPLMPFVSKSDVDYEFSKSFVKLWVDFAQSSTNLNTLEFMGQSWSPLKPGKPLQLMQLDSNPKMISNPMMKSVNFWKSLAL